MMFDFQLVPFCPDLRDELQEADDENKRLKRELAGATDEAVTII